VAVVVQEKLGVFAVTAQAPVTLQSRSASEQSLSRPTMTRIHRATGKRHYQPLLNLGEGRQISPGPCPEAVKSQRSLPSEWYFSRSRGGESRQEIAAKSI
jgi:hypothetical protein